MGSFGDASDLFINRRFDDFRLLIGPHGGGDIEAAGADALFDVTADTGDQLLFLADALIQPRAVAALEHRRQHLQRCLIRIVTDADLVADENLRRACQRIGQRLAALGGLLRLHQIDRRWRRLARNVLEVFLDHGQRCHRA